mgnify:CR=1 FL=1
MTPVYLSNEDSDVTGYLKAYVGYRSPVATTTPSTAVTSTTGSGTDIAVTRTAGGTELKWITQALKAEVTIPASETGRVIGNVWGKESAAGANAGLSFKLHKYTTTEGAAILTSSVGVECGTSIRRDAWDSGDPTATTFAVGNRLVIAPRVVNVGTMGASETVTLDFNGSTPGSDGDTYIIVNQTLSVGTETTINVLIDSILKDTQGSDRVYVAQKLDSVQDTLWNRILTMNEEILKVTGDITTLTADTSNLDFADEVTTGIPYSFQWLGVKYSGDSKYNEVRFVDGSDPEFIALDQEDATERYPVLAVIHNFTEVRFAPPLPSGTLVRLDYIYRPTDITVDRGAYEPDIPRPFHKALLAEATAECFIGQDEDNKATWHKRQSLDKLYGGLNVLKTRQFQQQFRTRSSRTGGR